MVAQVDQLAHFPAPIPPGLFALSLMPLSAKVGGGYLTLLIQLIHLIQIRLYDPLKDDSRGSLGGSLGSLIEGLRLQVQDRPSLTLQHLPDGEPPGVFGSQ